MNPTATFSAIRTAYAACVQTGTLSLTSVTVTSIATVVVRAELPPSTAITLRGMGLGESPSKSTGFLISIRPVTEFTWKLLPVSPAATEEDNVVQLNVHFRRQASFDL